MEQRTTVNIEMEADMAEQFEQRAKEMHLPVSSYIERVLQDRLEESTFEVPVHT